MITANICNHAGEPVTDDILIGCDADFAAVEARAIEIAATGTKCCIQWSRGSDGQVAYWGPAGACVKPHWYAKLGRPEEMRGGKRRNVYLDDASWAKAAAIGEGNASDGIRMALTAIDIASRIV